MTGAQNSAEHLLPIALQMSVPLLLAGVARLHGETRAAQIEAWRLAAVEAVAHKGDVLQYGSKRRGQTAAVFNATAQGVAALATAPGGVRVFGLIFCERHHPGGMTSRGHHVCPECLDAHDDDPELDPDDYDDDLRDAFEMPGARDQRTGKLIVSDVKSVKPKEELL